MDTPRSHSASSSHGIIKPLPVWLGAIAVFVACSSNPEGSGKGGGSGFEPVGFESYCERYSRITCEAASECDCLDGYSVELCMSVQEGECESDVEEPVNAGRMEYDSLAAGRCLSEIESIIADCSLEDDDYPESCDDMLVGLVEAGGACDGDDECRSGLECYDELCAAVPGEGEPCLDGGACASGSTCGEDSRCHAYVGIGGSCAGDEICDDNLYCDSRVDECLPYLGAGDSCAHASYACDDDLFCSSAGTCQPQQPEGTGCDEHEQCLSNDCVDGLCETDEEDDGCGLL